VHETRDGSNVRPVAEDHDGRLWAIQAKAYAPENTVTKADPLPTPRESGGRSRREAMATSKKDASLAGKQLASKSATKAQKSVAASDLAQSKAKGKAKGKK
jgi:hypothetical protein